MTKEFFGCLALRRCSCHYRVLHNAVTGKSYGRSWPGPVYQSYSCAVTPAIVGPIDPGNLPLDSQQTYSIVSYTCHLPSHILSSPVSTQLAYFLMAHVLLIPCPWAACKLCERGTPCFGSHSILHPSLLVLVMEAHALSTAWTHESGRHVSVVIMPGQKES